MDMLVKNVMDLSASPGGKPCRYGNACTRPGCRFKHPDQKSGELVYNVVQQFVQIYTLSLPPYVLAPTIPLTHLLSSAYCSATYTPALINNSIRKKVSARIRERMKRPPANSFV